MKIKKILYIFISILLILLTISIYNVRQFYNIEKIVNNLRIENGIEIELKEEPKWNFFPKIQLTLSGTLKNKVENYYSDNIKIVFNQLYKFVPASFTVTSNSFFIRDLQLKSLNILGNYNLINKKINFNNILAKIGDGNIALNGFIERSNKKRVEVKGKFKNLYLNQIFRQISIANWQRVDLKISSDNFYISSELSKNFHKKIIGNIPIKGSMYFVVTEEERFGVAFLKLLIEKLPNFSNLSKSLSQIIQGFGGEPSLIHGNLKINEGIFFTDDLNVNNKKNRIEIKGSYNYLLNFFDAKILFYELNNLIVEANITGSLEDPIIKILNQNIVTNSKEDNNDLKKLFDDGIQSLIDKLLGINE